MALKMLKLSTLTAALLTTGAVYAQAALGRRERRRAPSRRIAWKGAPTRAGSLTAAWTAPSGRQESRRPRGPGGENGAP